jgi:hypothetical protein
VCTVNVDNGYLIKERKHILQDIVVQFCPFLACWSWGGHIPALILILVWLRTNGGRGNKNKQDKKTNKTVTRVLVHVSFDYLAFLTFFCCAVGYCNPITA